MPVQASIIVPTYNRAKCLSACLEGLASQTTDPEAFEILIVDNNSTDTTRLAVLDFAASHPALSVRYVHETQQGAALARNRALATARGELLCFLDDDTVPSPGWLNSIRAGLADPTVGCVGGPALLDYQGQERPTWLHGDLEGLLSGYGLPYRQPTVVSEVAQYPFLCNMATRRGILAEVGSFRPDLGRAGDRKLAGEETELISRIRKGGWRVVYLPDAQVRHLVPPERLTKSYLYRIGRGLAATHVYLTGDRRLGAIIRWFLSDSWYSMRMLICLAMSLISRKPSWFDDYMRFWIVWMRIPLRIMVLLRGEVVYERL